MLFRWIFNISSCWEPFMHPLEYEMMCLNVVWSASASASCWIVVLPQSSLFPTGEFPIISPGRVYEYTSCTTFSTTSGYMEGHYTFHCLYYKDKFFNVTIPRFHMVCPTFKVSTARMVSGGAVVLILDHFFFSDLLFSQNTWINVTRAA